MYNFLAYQKLKTIFRFSIIVFIIHGLEEYFTSFYNIDSHSKFLLKPFLSMASYQTTFLIFQISFWTALTLISFFTKKIPTWIQVAVGSIYVYELHHWIKAIEVGGYYPGILSALAFPIIAIFYWKVFFQLHKT